MTRLVLDLTASEMAALRAAAAREDAAVSDGQAISIEEWAIDHLRRAARMDDRETRSSVARALGSIRSREKARASRRNGRLGGGRRRLPQCEEMVGGVRCVLAAGHRGRHRDVSPWAGRRR